ncbi:MAG: T9SS C-terminal target domain-containing protein [Cryomorphaceae bacterium]|nr:MAG: T9SS C-terminal target domain-containing protein [Cryomorphaceae bacterium]
MSSTTNKTVGSVFTKATFLALSFLTITFHSRSQTQCDGFGVEIIETTPVLCTGGDQGGLGVIIMGGEEPFQFTWSNGETTQEIEGLTAGVYSVIVIDAQQCLTEAFFFLNQPEPDPIEVLFTPPACGSSDGVIEITNSGNIPPYSYALNNGALGDESLFDNLQAGAYTVQVQNGNGCLVTEYVALNHSEVSNPDLQLSSSVDCFGNCNGQLEVTGAEGSWQWFSVDENGSTTSLAGSEAQLAELCAGQYMAVQQQAVGEGGEPVEDVFWFEDFGTGCNQGQLAHEFVSENGTWTVVNTGTNQNDANTFFISATEQIGADGCGAGCGAGGQNNRTLHVSNVLISFFGVPLVQADGGALYYADATTNRRVESPVIDCSGQENITMSFDYIEFGQGDLDNATLWYFDGTEWSLLDDMPKTTCCGGPCNGFNQGNFAEYSVSLPESANNNPNVRFAFNWTNNNDGQGSDPSFAVDNIAFTGTSEGTTFCQAYSQVLEITQPQPLDIIAVKWTESICVDNTDGSILVQAFGGEMPYSFEWNIDSIGPQISNLGPGTYTVTVTDGNDCQQAASFEVVNDIEPGSVDFNLNLEGATLITENLSSQGDYLWDFGDGNTSEDFAPIHLYQSEGSFEVCLTLTDDCGAQTMCETVAVFTTSVVTKKMQNPVVFPNPASGRVQLAIGDRTHVLGAVWDSRGALVLSFETHADLILDISGWTPGVYLIQLTDTQRGENTSLRLVVSQ